MAIRGTLEHLGLAGVLQLIGQNARHGVLTIDHGVSQANLFFASGQLVRADGTAENKEDAVGLRLVAAGLVTQAALQEAIAAGTGRPLQLLIDRGLLPASTAELFAGLHSTETVHRAMGWDSGSYAFLPANEPPLATHSGQRADHLLMDALRALDGWPALRARVPHKSFVFAVSRSLEDYLVTQAMTAQTSLKDDFSDNFGFSELDTPSPGQGAAAKGELSHNDRLVYSLIDGKRDVQEVIDRSALTAFNATASLVTLMDAQLVAQSDRAPEHEQARSTLVLQAAPKKLVWRLKDAAPWALRIGYVAAGLAAMLWLDPARGLSGAQLLPRLAWQQQAPMIMESLEVVRARTGTYPNQLPARSDGVAPLYASTGAGYQLRWRAEP